MPETINKQFTFWAPFTGYTIRKTAGGDEKYIVTGLASNTNIDLTGERMAKSAIASMVKSIETHPVAINNEHSRDWDADFGDVTRGWPDDQSNLMIEAELNPDHYRTKTLIKALDKGKQLGLSIGGTVKDYDWESVDGVTQPVLTYKDIDIFHVAITGSPAVPDTYVNALHKSIKDWKETPMPGIKKDVEVIETVETIDVIETAPLAAPLETPVATPADAPTEPQAPAATAAEAPAEPEQPIAPAVETPAEAPPAPAEPAAEAAPEPETPDVPAEQAPVAEPAPADTEPETTPVAADAAAQEAPAPASAETAPAQANADTSEAISQPAPADAPTNGVAVEAQVDELSKSLATIQANLEELTKALSLKDEELEQTRKSLDDAQLAQKQAQDELDTTNKRKQVMLSSKFDTQLSKSEQQAAINAWAELIAGGH